MRLSEDAACARIEAARACRRFPEILDRLAQGSLSLTSVRLLSRHLTPENHASVLARACGRSRREIEVLVAELAPRRDAPAVLRRLPSAKLANSAPAMATPTTPPLATASRVEATPSELPAPLRVPRPMIQASAPARYRVQFTIGEETHEKLRRLQILLRREFPDGDPAAIVDRALGLLLDRVERAKPAKTREARAVIRPGADGVGGGSRHVPRQVKRAVWERDRGRCAFLSEEGVRCRERAFLEWHHIQPHALNGPATVDNIALRCRSHNRYEAQLVFGRQAAITTERRGAHPPQRGPRPV